MAYVYARIKKPTLEFIRSKKSISFDYILRKTNFSQEKIEMWENEDVDKWPTIAQAKKLAQCYRVPFAGFYMDHEDINIKFLPKIMNKRTFSEFVNDESAVNLAIYDLMNDREFYLETKEEFNERIPKFDISINSNSINEWARTIRQILGFDLKKQYKCPSTRQLYLLLRGMIEEKGIFVQCFRGVDVEVMRGVSISYESVPIIGINDDDRYPAKTFTLLHELVHIIKKSSSMCNEIYNSFVMDREEVFCNSVAGEVLIPSKVLLEDYEGCNEENFTLEKVDYLAKRFSVSSEVVIRRLYDCQICSKYWYDTMSERLKQRFIQSKEDNKKKRQLDGKDMKRNMPREAIDRTSTDLCRVLVRGYSEGMFDKSDLSGHIGIKTKHIDNFVAEVMKWYR